MNVILFDEPQLRLQLLPLTFTRPVAMIRTGILTIGEKWANRLKCDVSCSTAGYLSNKFKAVVTGDNYWINGAWCPTDEAVRLIRQLNPGDAIRYGNRVLAVRTPDDEVPEVITGTVHELAEAPLLIDRPWKIFQHNGPQIRSDFSLITAGRKSELVNDSATVVYNPSNVFIEAGVTLKAAIINAENGPVYLGKESQVQEGAIIRGPFALGEGAMVLMGGKMRGDTTIGPWCKVGGEIANSVLFSYSNKSHDGYLGNSVLGEWCNLGADTNTSNMKNTYDFVRLYSHTEQAMIDTGLPFCGLIMGDHSKSGINTMFNTGTVVGVNCNVLGGGYPPNFIPSFSWAQTAVYDLDKALATAGRAMSRRSQEFTAVDQEVMKNVFDLTRNDRLKLQG